MENIKNIGIQKVKKLQIPKKVKQLVWNTYIGEEKGVAQCLCCDTTKISQMDFTCGHIQSEANGGSTSVDNLKPICALCNSSMGTKNMNEFMEIHKLTKQNESKMVTTKKIIYVNAYYCKCCKYHSEKLSNFKNHLASKKHMTLDLNDISGVCKESVDFSIFKKKIFCCNKCNSTYLSNQHLKNHQKICQTDDKLENDKLKLLDEIEVDSDSEPDEVPVKIIAKKKK